MEEDNSDECDYKADENASLDSKIDKQEKIVARSYPARHRQARQLTGVVPWDSKQYEYYYLIFILFVLSDGEKCSVILTLPPVVDYY